MSLPRLPTSLLTPAAALILPTTLPATVQVPPSAGADLGYAEMADLLEAAGRR